MATKNNPGARAGATGAAIGTSVQHSDSTIRAGAPLLLDWRPDLCMGRAIVRLPRGLPAKYAVYREPGSRVWAEAWPNAARWPALPQGGEP